MKKIVFFLLFFITFFLGKSQYRAFVTSTLSQDDGLSQGSNYFRYEDSHGFMWITGNDALNRYDGSSVKAYKLNYFFKNCPALQQGYGFAEDGKNLYIGSTRGVYVYDYDLDQFTLIDIFKHSQKTKTAIPIGVSKGKLWCFNEAWQLVSYHVKNKTIQLEAKIPFEPMKSVHVYGNEGNLFYFRKPFIDKWGNICLISKNDLVVYNPENHQSYFPLAKFNSNKEITFLCSAYNTKYDQLFIGTKDHGVMVVENKYQNTKLASGVDKNVTSIATDENLLICKSPFSIKILDKNFNQLQTIDGYSTSYGYGFDKAGRLWVCKDGFGQVIFDFKERILKNSNNIDQGKMFFTTGISNFAELSDKSMWIHNYCIFDSEKQTYQKKEATNFSIFRDFYNKGFWYINHEFVEQSIKSIYFLGNDLNKKYSVDFDKNTMGIFKHLYVFPNGYTILSFINGLFAIDTHSKKLKKISSLPDNNPFYISPISQNRIAISYLNNDMLLVQKNPDNSFAIIKKILPKVQSFYIQEDLEKNRFWVGSNEGVFLLDKNYNILKKFDSNNGLSGTYIYGLLLDDLGNAWCSHQHGLSSIDGKNYHIINYDKNDGIQGWDFNNRAFYKATDGTLYFGGMNGFNYFKPPIALQSVYNPEIYFDEIFINNKKYISHNGLNIPKEIHLNNDENNIAIKVLVKDLLFGKSRNLFYRIKNKDQEWSLIAQKELLNFYSLAPGKYEIEFALNDKFTPEITPLKSLTIIIEKAFYQTYGFWILMGGLFFGGLIYLYDRRKFAKQKQYFSHQLALETQRNKITEDLHDDLGATLSSLYINSVIAGTIVDKDKVQTKAILKKIENQAQHISENISDIVWSLKPNKDALMTLSTRIRNFANEIMGSSNIYYKIKIDEVIDTEITDFAIKKNIVLIVKEALNNAVKYSKAKNLNLSLTKINNEYILQIQDDGLGFDVEKKQGNGLQNMQKRTKEMNGFFQLSTTGGTCIKISIPIFRE